MTSFSVEISVDANGELWSINGQFDVTKTVIKGRSDLPGLVNNEYCFVDLLSVVKS